MDLRKYKVAALIGIIIMGIGSFMACLATVSGTAMAGSILLILSLVILTYAFSAWQP